MIRYDLICERDHRFDGWFRSSADFDLQATRGYLSCPVCGSDAVTKALMAPSIATRRGAAAPQDAPAEPAAAPPKGAAPAQEMALVSEKEQALRAMLREIRDHVTKTAENVGERFPDMARRMHAEEIEQKSIYGRATPDEVKALAEDGIDVHPLPRFPDDGN